jgi:hypothetical protein
MGGVAFQWPRMRRAPARFRIGSLSLIPQPLDHTEHMLNAVSGAMTTAPFIPQIRLYQDWLRSQRGLAFGDYGSNRG